MFNVMFLVMLLSSWAYVGESVLVKSDNTVLRLDRFEGNAQMQFETTDLPRPTPKVLVHPRPAGAVHPVTKITVPAHYSVPVAEVKAWIGTDRDGYWPIDQTGAIDSTNWRSSVEGQAFSGGLA